MYLCLNALRYFVSRHTAPYLHYHALFSPIIDSAKMNLPNGSISDDLELYCAPRKGILGTYIKDASRFQDWITDQTFSSREAYLRISEF